jgi:hypothetical protein
MSELQNTTRLHPKTVSEHEQHVKKRRGQAKVRKNGKVRHVKVDSRVWGAAMELAEGDRQRLEVKAPDEVVVLNNPRRGR